MKADEDYPNNDEEFYTNEDRNQNLSDSSPPATDDSGKEPISTDNIYSSGGGSVGSGAEYQQHRDELEAEMGLKDTVTDMQMDFGNMKNEEKSKLDFWMVFDDIIGMLRFRISRCSSFQSSGSSVREGFSSDF